MDFDSFKDLISKALPRFKPQFRDTHFDNSFCADLPFCLDAGADEENDYCAEISYDRLTQKFAVYFEVSEYNLSSDYAVQVMQALLSGVIPLGGDAPVQSQQDLPNE